MSGFAFFVLFASFADHHLYAFPVVPCLNP